MSYLGLPGMNQYRADALPHELLCRIQNLLPDKCHLCKQNYCIKLEDKPIMSCARCGQGCHNGCVIPLLGITTEDLNEDNQFGALLANPNSALGLFYLCGYCQKEAIPDKEQLKVRNSSRRNSLVSGNPPTLVPNVDINESSDTEGTSRARIGETSLRTEHIQINLRPEATVEASVADGANTASQQSSLSYRREGQSSQHLTENRPVCKFYRRGRCKYGISGKKKTAPACNTIQSHVKSSWKMELAEGEAAHVSLTVDSSIQVYAILHCRRGSA